MIHYVPAHRKARSVGKTEETLKPWTGSFDEDNLRNVHRSALVPFVHMGVLNYLQGYRHRKDPNDRAKLLADPKVQERYLAAFQFVEMAINFEEHGSLSPLTPNRHLSRRSKSFKGPNFQLYDLLAAIAMNFDSPDLLCRTRSKLAGFRFNPPAASVSQANVCCDKREQHSRHSKRKCRNKTSTHHVQRIEKLLKVRLGEHSHVEAAAGCPQVGKTASLRKPQTKELRPANQDGAWSVALLSLALANQIRVAGIHKGKNVRARPRHRLTCQ
jgi:hypothetical protein